MTDTDVITAADHYRRATELVATARADLIAAVTRDRKEVNLRGVSRRAGLHESTLHHWVTKELSANGGNPTA